MNTLDPQYQLLLEDILESGNVKETRNGKTVSVFGRQIRHRMKNGFPLLTSKKMAWKSVVGELLWFLRGSSDIRDLWEMNVHIWDGDYFKRYYDQSHEWKGDWPDTLEDFIERCKTDEEFGNRWCDLGPIYGKQWRSWKGTKYVVDSLLSSGLREYPIDQLKNLIEDLKSNPDSRRMMVNSWNVGQLNDMILPPCHYGFQVYTRLLTWQERRELATDIVPKKELEGYKGDDGYWYGFGYISPFTPKMIHHWLDRWNVPTREVSLMWNQRSVDVPLGLPFNIASYGLLLEMIAHDCNMVAGELIGNLGDCHIYENQIDGVKEQLNRNFYDLPKLEINTSSLSSAKWITLEPEKWNQDDFRITDYKSEDKINFPLSN